MERTHLEKPGIMIHCEGNHLMFMFAPQEMSKASIPTTTIMAHRNVGLLATRAKCSLHFEEEQMKKKHGK